MSFVQRQSGRRLAGFISSVSMRVGALLNRLGCAFDHIASALADESTAAIEPLSDFESGQYQGGSSRRDLLEQISAVDEHAIVSICDIRGNITFVNEKFVQISGYSRDELLGNNHRVVKSGSHSREFYRQMWQVITKGEVWSGEIDNLTKDGTHYWVAATIVPFLNSDGKPERYISIRTDITERKHAELRSLVAESRAHEALECQEQFIANMSHELRTPLNAVLGLSSLLLKSELDEEQLEFVQLIHDSGDGLICIINDILDFSKIESGALLLDQKALDLEKVVQGTLDLLEPKLQDAKLSLRLRYSQSAPTAFISDEGRVRQILLNLIGNAIKFTKQGYVEVSVVCESISEGEARMQISVEDTGVGIAEDHLEQVFDRFVQADTSARRIAGTGLGLAITKRLTEAMGGSLGVKSALGVGSMFIVTLPLRLVTAEVENDKAVFSSQILTTPIAARVLLVEDNLVNQKVARRILEKAGCTVECALDGIECLSILTASDFDLILMDVQMPNMDGIEACRRIREQQTHSRAGRPIPIVALTANAMAGDRDRCIEAGMDDYLSKPINPQHLRHAIERWSSAPDLAD